MKSALFVDFDNVYSGLRQLDQASADRFARKPGEWVDWLIESLGLPEHSPDGAKRRVLVRRCYLNPQAYQRFRPSFNLAGFEIVDCPALTSEGKTSTDIHMVLDIVDLLQHEVRYDEFIVFSADADFTPVLRKLRRWDRRTTVLAIGFPSAAYRASADLLIDQDNFVRSALGFDDEAETKQPTQPTAPPAETTATAIKLIREAVAESMVPVPLAKLAALILSKIDGMDASSWAGFGSFRSLIESKGLSPLVISWDGGGIVYDPKRHTLPTPQPNIGSSSQTQDAVASVANLIKSEVSKAKQPVPCGRLATLIIEKHGSLATDWNGKGTFRKFIESLDVRPVLFDWNGSGGAASDPEHHPTVQIDKPSASQLDWKNDLDLLPTAKQIHEVTGIPLLSPAKYKTLFGAIETDVAGHPFHLMETGKRVRDLCREAGMPISRADVTYVLRGLLIRGHAFDEGENNAITLGRKLTDNVRSLCLREQMVLDQVTDSALAAWISGGE